MQLAGLTFKMSFLKRETRHFNVRNAVLVRLQEICKRAKEHPELLDEEARRKLEELKKRFALKK